MKCVFFQKNTSKLKRHDNQREKPNIHESKESQLKHGHEKPYKVFKKTVPMSPSMDRPPLHGILLVGGMDPFGHNKEQSSTLVQQYSLADDRWIVKATIPEPRHHHAIVVLGDNMYVLGK